MQTVLKNINSADVASYFIWMPCIMGDSRDEAVERVSEFQDPRVHNYWDDKRISGDAWQERLGLSSFAWDTYFIFDRSVVWHKNVPEPTFWMHQIRSAEDKAPFLDEKEFESRLKTILAIKDKGVQ
jgi:hypothetical protein